MVQSSQGMNKTQSDNSSQDTIVSVYYRVFHLKKLDSTLCLGDFLWYSEAVIGVKSSNRVGALTFRQEN